MHLNQTAAAADMASDYAQFQQWRQSQQQAAPAPAQHVSATDQLIQQVKAAQQRHLNR